MSAVLGDGHAAVHRLGRHCQGSIPLQEILIVSAYTFNFFFLNFHPLMPVPFRGRDAATREAEAGEGWLGMREEAGGEGRGRGGREVIRWCLQPRGL